MDGCGDGSSEGDDGEGASGTVRLNAMHACTSQAALVVNTLDEKCAISDSFMSAFKSDDRMLAVGIVGIAGIDGAGGFERVATKQVKKGASTGGEVLQPPRRGSIEFVAVAEWEGPQERSPRRNP